MSGPELTISIRTVAELRAAKAVEAELQKQIVAAKAAGAEYGHLEEQLAAVGEGIRSKGFVGGATSELMGLAERIPVVGALMRSLNGGVGLASGAFVAFAGALGVAKKALKSFSEMEDLQTNFVTLLGNMDAAKKRMAELSQFAAATPFNLPEIARASRVLEGLTDGVLSTGEGLRLVGDVAASTGTSFDEISVTIGRMYAGLKNGQPIGEVAARLTELTGQNFRSVESWEQARAMLERYNGSMSNLSETISGKQSTLADSLNMLLVQLGRPVAPVYKEALESLIGVLDRATNGLEKFLDAAERHGNVLRPIVGALVSMAAIWGGKALFGQAASAIAGITALLARKKLALDAESAALARNTAAQTANAAARARVGAMAGAGLAGGILPAAGAAGSASRGTPFSREVYRAERERGLTATDALASARKIMANTTAEAAKAAPVWSKLKGGIASASAGLGKLAGQLFSLKGIIAGVAAEKAVGYASEQAGNFVAGQMLGGRTSKSDMEAAATIRAESARKEAELVERARALSTKEDREALLAEIGKLTQAAAGKVREAGFFEDPRDAQNFALADASRSLARLAKIVGAGGELPTAADLQAQQLRDGEAARQEALSRRLREEENRREIENLEPEDQLRSLKIHERGVKDRQAARFSSEAFGGLSPEDQAAEREAANEEILEIAKLRAALEKSIAESKAQQAKEDAEAEVKARRATVELENQLKIEAMRAKGNHEAAARMENELRIAADLAALRENGISDEALLQAHETARRQALEDSLRLRREELELEVRLAEARAAGDAAEIRRLEWMQEYNAKLASGATYDQARRLANASVQASAPEERNPLQERFSQEDAFNSLSNQRQQQVRRDMLDQYSLNPRNADGSKFTPAQHLAGMTPADNLLPKKLDPAWGDGKSKSADAAADAAAGAADAAEGAGDKVEGALNRVAGALEKLPAKIDATTKEAAASAQAAEGAAQALSAALSNLRARIAALESAAT